MDDDSRQKWHEGIRKVAHAENWTDDRTKALITRVDRLLSQGLPIILNFSHLAKWLSMKTPDLGAMVYKTDKHYKQFLIKKRSGGWRDISAPSIRLKTCQRWILQNILHKTRLHDAAHGFVRHRSIASNASIHLEQQIVMNLDLRTFFPSIPRKRIFGIFRVLGYDRRVSFYLSRLTTLEEKLPQGAPTSPALSNITARHLDKRLAALGSKNGFVYSRYADDLTFSGEEKLLTVLPLIRRIINEEGFIVNENKTRIMRAHRQQEVTGLVVNKKVSVKRSHRRWLRQQSYYLRKFGLQDCKKKTQTQQKNTREFIYGHALFLRMIDAERGEELLKELDTVAW